MANEKREYVLDRWEGCLAICEEINTRDILILNKNDIPGEASVGDVLYLFENEYFIDTEKTSERKQNIKNLFDRLFR